MILYETSKFNEQDTNRFKAKAISLIIAGLKNEDIAMHTGLSISEVERIKSKFEQTEE